LNHTRFLLPALQIQTVLEEPTLSTRRKALDTTPKKLDDAFGITIKRIKEQSKARANQAMEVLKWALLAKRQLTISELKHALAVNLGDAQLDWDNLPPEKSLTEWCLGLVILDKETSSIRLVHKALSEYLMREHKMGRFFEHGHSEIAQTYLTYIGFEDDSVDLDPDMEYTIFRQRLQQHLERFCLLFYAICQWRSY
jgi:hypothetical protein